MTIPVRYRAVLIVFILLIASGNGFALGGKEDPMVKADALIKAQQYDQAILYLTEFMKNNPDRFDAAQERLKRIYDIRTDYYNKAEILLTGMDKNTLDDDGRLKLITELERIEKNPNPTLKIFMEETKSASLFTSNRNKFAVIMDNGRILIDAGQFVEAAKTYESGYVLYREEFDNANFDEITKSRVSNWVDQVKASIIAMENLRPRLEAATTALKNAFSGEDEAAMDVAWPEFEVVFLLLMKERRLTQQYGQLLEKQFAVFSSADAAVTDDSFLPFAFRLTLGRGNIQKALAGTAENTTAGTGATIYSQPEGIMGVADSQWTYLMGQVQRSFNEREQASFAKAEGLFTGGTWVEAQAEFTSYARLMDRGLKFLGLWSLYTPTDLLKGSSEFARNALLSKGADFLRYRFRRDTASAYAHIASIHSARDTTNALFTAFNPTATDGLAGTLATFKTFRDAIIARTAELEGESAFSLKRSQRLDAWVTAKFNSGSSLTDQGAFDVRLKAFKDELLALEVAIVANAGAFEYGTMESYYVAQTQRIAEGERLLSGILGSDDTTAVPAKYPTRSIEVLVQVDADIKGLRLRLASYLTRLRSEASYISGAAPVVALIDKALALDQAASQQLAASAKTLAAARAEQTAALSARREAERRLEEARVALAKEDFETAKERLERSAERFGASLAIESDEILSNSSFNALDALGKAIVKTENDKVVREVRALITNGRKLYDNGSLPESEQALIQARERWNVTNSGAPNTEIVYWLRIVQSALSVTSGTKIAMGDSSYPAVASILSLARKYYDEGRVLLEARSKPDALRAFTLALNKVSEVRRDFPLNQEARILELRIQQTSDPVEANKLFEGMLAEALRKITPGTDKETLKLQLNDLKALQAINPRFPGLAAAIGKAEILIEDRPPPPSAEDVRESLRLTNAAQDIWSQGLQSNFPKAIEWLDTALTLNPNNNQAIALIDRIRTGVIQVTGLVLPPDIQALFDKAQALFQANNGLGARLALNQIYAKDIKYKKYPKIMDLDQYLAGRGFP